MQVVAQIWLIAQRMEISLAYDNKSDKNNIFILLAHLLKKETRESRNDFFHSQENVHNFLVVQLNYHKNI